MLNEYSALYRKMTGTRLRSLPLFAVVGVLGLAFTMPLLGEWSEDVTPQEVGWLGRGLRAVGQLGVLLGDLVQTHDTVYAWLVQIAVFGIIAIPCTLILKSLLTWSADRLVGGGFTFLLGAVALPVLGWIFIGCSFLLRLVRFLIELAHTLIVFILPALRVIGLIALAVAVVGLLIWALAKYRAFRLPFGVLIAVGLVVAFIPSVRTVVLAVLAPVVHFLGCLFGWVFIIVGVVGLAVVVILLALIVVFLGLLVMGQLGLAFISPYVAAWRSGRERADFLDSLAGLGLTLSLLLSAAVTQPDLSSSLAGALRTWPPGGVIDTAVRIYEILLPEPLQAFLAAAQSGTNGVLELAQLALMAPIFALAVLFGRTVWVRARPILVARLGLVRIAAQLVLAVIALALSDELNES